MEREALSNMWFIKNEILKSAPFLDEFLIAGAQQAEQIFEVLRSFNLLTKFQNEKNNLIVVPNSITNQESLVNLVINYFC